MRSFLSDSGDQTVVGRKNESHGNPFAPPPLSGTDARWGSRFDFLPTIGIERFRGDSYLRHASLNMGGGIQFGVASKFFTSFRYAWIRPPARHAFATVFGNPAPPKVPECQDVFNALFRHFSYALGHDLVLPKGAFYAGSSCVAATAVPPWTSQHSLRGFEQRAQRKIAEPVVERTLGRLFPGKWPIVQKIASFATDPFTLNDFNEGVAQLLDRPGQWGHYVSESSDEDDEEGERAVHGHFDGDGRGPYARADLDIIIVAESKDLARPIIDATIAKVTKSYKNGHRIYETPCSIQIVGDFPQRHVQIITVLNKSLDEYLLFVDMDCTALAFDGRDLYGCQRSYMALNSGVNIVPQKMLEIRSDTPRRLHKYACRGFASLIPGSLSARSEELLDQARAIRAGRDGLKFLDLEWFDTDGAAIDAICSKEGRMYTETSLPRGYGITAAMTDVILSRLQQRAIAQGRAVCVHAYEGSANLVFKSEKRPENWVTWGLCS